jgi:steroid delta-isomerase-like uncharacterized protein
VADTDNVALMRRYYEEVVNQGDFSVVDELFSADYHSHHNDPIGLPPGPEGVKQFIGGTRAGFPDLQLTLDDIFGEGDLVASRWTLRGTHTEEWFGTPATNKSAEWAGIQLSRFEDGKIAEEWFNFDQLRLLQELEIIPSG